VGWLTCCLPAKRCWQATAPERPDEGRFGPAPSAHRRPARIRAAARARPARLPARARGRVHQGGQVRPGAAGGLQRGARDAQARRRTLLLVPEVQSPSLAAARRASVPQAVQGRRPCRGYGPSRSAAPLAVGAHERICGPRAACLSRWSGWEWSTLTSSRCTTSSTRTTCSWRAPAPQLLLHESGRLCGLACVPGSGGRMLARPAGLRVGLATVSSSVRLAELYHGWGSVRVGISGNRRAHLGGCSATERRRHLTRGAPRAGRLLTRPCPRWPSCARRAPCATSASRACRWTPSNTSWTGAPPAPALVPAHQHQHCKGAGSERGGATAQPLPG